MNEPKKPKRLGRTTIYQSRWVNLHLDRVELPDGRIIEQHHVLDFEREAVLVLTENEQAEILLAKVYRYVTDSIGWELPGGGIEKGETILEAARREVLEETGFETTNHRLVYSFNNLNGIANHTAHIVFCKALNDTGKFDKGEIESVHWLKRADIVELLERQAIKDDISLVGLLLYLNGKTS